VTALPLSKQEFSTIPDEVWRKLGDLLRSTGVCEKHPRVFALSEVSFEPELRALRQEILRAADDTAARLLRMFWLADPVARDAADAALGADFSDLLLRFRVVEQVEGGLVSSLVIMRFMGDFLLAEDLRRGGDAVMGVGVLTSRLVQAVRSNEQLASVLDLGCGAGAVSLALASAAGRVTATDVNPRAAALVRGNAALRGVSNIETLVGDLFTPVAGRRFDCVLFHPPFLANAEGAIFAEGGERGGERGDELALRALGEAAAHLNDGGIAVIVGELPIVDDTAIEAAVSAVVGADVNLLVAERGEVDLDAFSIGVAAHKYQALGPLFDQAVLARRAHFDRMKISSLRNVIVVVARARGPAFRGTFQMSRAAEAILSRRDIDALFRSFGLIAAGKEALGAARLRLRPEVELARLADGSAVLHASPSCPLQIEGFGAETMKLIDSLRAGKPVTDTIRKLTSHPSTHVHRPSLLLATEQLLRAGVLEVAG